VACSLTVTCQTCNPEVAQVTGSTPCRDTVNLGQVVYTHVPLSIKQYKLVPASPPGLPGKVTAVICGGLALLPYIRQGRVHLYWVAGEASVARCRPRALETEMSTARIGHRAVRGPVDYR